MKESGNNSNKRGPINFKNDKTLLKEGQEKNT